MFDNLKRFMAELRYKFANFMQGRYGSDDLNRTAMYITIALTILQIFVKSRILNTVTLLLIILVYFRMFSRNISKRYQENRIFLDKTQGLRDKIAKKKYEFSQMKDYHIYRCPNCKQKIRVPRGKGKIAIRCRKCGTEFVKKS